MQSSISEFDAYFSQGTLLLRAGDLAEALAHFKTVYAGAEAAGNADLMAASLCEMAWACFKLGDLEQGLECALGAKWLWRRLDNPEEVVRALAVEAFLYLDLGFGDEAFDLAGEALDLARTLNAPAMLAFALNARGLVLSVCQESDLALSLIEQAVAIAQDLDNPAAAAFYTLILGFAHAKMADVAGKLEQPEQAEGQRALAIHHSIAAAALAETAGDFWTLRVALCNTAEFLSAAGRNDEAVALLDRWAALPGVASASLRIHRLYTLALVQLAAGQHDPAHAAAAQALSLAEANGQVDHQVNAAEVMSRILEAQGDARAALAMHRRYHSLYIQQSGESVRRRARVEEIRAETGRLRARAAELADQALCDSLTGIANRRSFDQILNRLAGTPFAIAILDLDHFKQVNDLHSHITGDAVLQRVARIMVDQLGRNGHAARLGGEEFALILPDASPNTAAAICEGVRVSVHNSDWSHLAPGLAISVSIGVAAGDGSVPAGALMQMADHRLYEAKSHGRNCVRVEPMFVVTGVPDRRRNSPLSA